MIVQREGQWCVLSADGQQQIGCYATPELAQRRLAQIEGHADARTDALGRLAVGDAAQVYRVDRIGTIYAGDREVPRGGLAARIDPVTGFLRVPRSHIARTGPLVYGDGEREWVEYRDDEALFSARALESFSNLVMTREHPPVLVTADNARTYQVGHTGRAERDGCYLDASEIVITDRAAIARAQQPGGWELSIGFLADVARRDGVTRDGVTYQYVQTNLEGNHLAGTEMGRAGPECRLAMDSAVTVTALHPGETVTITTAPATVADASQHSQGEAPEGDMMMEKEEPKADAIAGTPPAQTVADPPPKQEIDTAALIRARVKIVDSAGKILGQVDHDADDETLMLAVVAKVDGAEAIKGAADWSRDYTRARFDAAIITSERAKRVDTARQIAGIADAFAVGRSGQDSVDLDDALAKLNNYYADAWKHPRGEVLQ